MRLTGVEDFEAFVLARGPALVRFAHALTGDRHLAEDLVQEVLVKVHRRWGSITGSPEAYARTAVCRELVSLRRRRWTRERAGAVPDTGAADRVPLEEHDALLTLLARLPARQRQVLVLRYWQDLPDDEIARLLRCSTGTVRSSAARAFAALRLHPDLVPEGAP